MHYIEERQITFSMFICKAYLLNMHICGTLCVYAYHPLHIHPDTRSHADTGPIHISAYTRNMCTGRFPMMLLARPGHVMVLRSSNQSPIANSVQCKVRDERPSLCTHFPLTVFCTFHLWPLYHRPFFHSLFMLFLRTYFSSFFFFKNFKAERMRWRIRVICPRLHSVAI